MSFRIALIILVGLAIVSVGSAFVLNKLSNPAAIAQTVELKLAKPWIEVLVEPVFESDSKDAKISRELQTGDEVAIGKVVESKKGGLANIHFPDGSVARLDSETKVILSEAYFNADNNKLVVRINLSAGRVWSKIISLATPDSAWEVKTSNAVATVRGTAFGMEFKDGKSTVVVSQHKVSVAAVNAKTQEPMNTEAVMVEEGELVALSNEDAELMGDLESAAPAVREVIRKDMGLMKVESLSQEILSQDWIKRGVEADNLIETKIQDLKRQGVEGKEMRQELRSSLKAELQIIIGARLSSDAKVLESKPESSSALKATTESIINLFTNPSNNEENTSENLADVNNKAVYGAELRTADTASSAAIPVISVSDASVNNAAQKIAGDVSASISRSAPTAVKNASPAITPADDESVAPTAPASVITYPATSPSLLPSPVIETTPAASVSPSPAASSVKDSLNSTISAVPSTVIAPVISPVPSLTPKPSLAPPPDPAPAPVLVPVAIRSIGL